MNWQERAILPRPSAFTPNVRLSCECAMQFMPVSKMVDFRRLETASILFFQRVTGVSNQRESRLEFVLFGGQSCNLLTSS
jgi:hypothetical protein